MKEADRRIEKIIIGKANTNRQKIQKDAHSQGQRFLHFSLTAAVRPLFHNLFFAKLSDHT